MSDESTNADASDEPNVPDNAPDPRENGSCPCVVDVLMGPAHPMYRPWMECTLHEGEIVLAFISSDTEILTYHCSVKRMLKRHWDRVLWYASVGDICIDLHYMPENDAFADLTTYAVEPKRGQTKEEDDK